VKDLLHVLGESHVEHAVGFVEHRDLDATQIQRLAREMVEHASRCADGDVNAALERRDLRAQRLSAGDDEDPESIVFASQFADLARDLRAQFAGRAKHERLHVPPVQRHRLQNRQRKRQGLPATRLGLADQVLPGEQHRNPLRLNRRHLDVAEFARDLDQRRRNREG